MFKKVSQIALLLVSMLAPILLATVVVSAASAPTQFTIPDTAFTIKGFASPGAFVQIFDGDAVIGTVIADQNGIFEKNFPAMASGLHNIKMQFQDNSGLQSETVSQTINIRPQADTAIEYYLPPTLTVDPDYVIEGNLVNFSGSTLPNATVEIILDGGNLILRPQSDSNGNFSISVDTTGYYFGEHAIRATSLLGGLKSFQTQKHTFKVVPVDATSENPGTAERTLQPPVITTGGIVSTETEGNLLRGTATPYSQVIIYSNGDPIGSTFASSDGTWFFNVDVATATTELQATACIGDECSDFSNVLTYEFAGQFGQCSTFDFWLEEYRFWGLQQDDGLNIPVTGIAGTPKFDVLIDWGDDTTERFNRDNERAFNIHHTYSNFGQYSGSITMLDDNKCEHTVFFSVDVAEDGFEIPLVPSLAALLLVPLGFFIRGRYVLNKRRARLAR